MLDAFGADRTMVGSDRLLCTLATTFDVALDVYDLVLPDIGRSDHEALYADTAQRVYRLPHRAPVGPQPQTVWGRTVIDVTGIHQSGSFTSGDTTTQTVVTSSDPVL